MKEDKLRDLSMELSVEVLKLTKELRSKHENDNERRCCNNEIVQQNNSYCVNRFDFNTIIVVLFKRGNQQFFKRSNPWSMGQDSFG